MIRNKRTFIIGVIMLLSFTLVFVGIMSPIYGNGRNGLNYADDIFNSLSKGSVYFIKDAQEVADSQKGKNINLTVNASSPEEAVKWGDLYTEADVNVIVQESSVTIDGDFSKILGAVVVDSDFMYHNDSESLETRYGYDGKEAIYNWNNSFEKIKKVLTDEKKFAEVSVLDNIQKKAIEPAYNYYGIEGQKVKENVATLTFLLAFYLVYTMWYGFGLYFFFDGFGIVVAKPRKAT